MNNDIRLSTSYPDHPKVKRLRRRLGERGVCCHIFLLCWTGRVRPDGRFSGMDEYDIAEAAGWPGEPGELVGALHELGLLDRGEDGVYAVHDWGDHNEYALHAPDRRRKAKRAADARWGGKREKVSAEGEVDTPTRDRGSSEECSDSNRAMPESASSNAPTPSPVPSPEHDTPQAPLGEGGDRGSSSSLEEVLKKLLTDVPGAHRGKASVRKEIRAALDAGVEAGEIRRNILYTNRHSKANYGAYLAGAIRADYGRELGEREETVRRVEEQKRAEEAAERERQRLEDEAFREVERRFDALPEAERKRLMRAARASPAGKLCGPDGLRIIAVDRFRKGASP